jgi:hypothetical protein
MNIYKAIAWYLLTKEKNWKSPADADIITQEVEKKAIEIIKGGK